MTIFRQDSGNHVMGMDEKEIQELTRQSMKQLVNPDNVPALIDDLKKNKDWKVRRDIVSLLWYSGDVRAVPALIDALKDKDPEVRKHAAFVLGEIADVRAVPALINCLKDKYVRRNAAKALEKITEKCESVEKLNELQKKTEDFFKEWNRKQPQGRTQEKAEMEVRMSKLLTQISKRKAELSKKDGLQLGDTIKKPKDGKKIYREIRKVIRNA